jgi:hypothetical protein
LLHLEGGFIQSLALPAFDGELCYHLCFAQVV